MNIPKKIWLAVAALARDFRDRAAFDAINAFSLECSYEEIMFVDRMIVAKRRAIKRRVMNKSVERRARGLK
ncbi:MAG: hypothetical protein LBQ81_09710 [Zoogloeaceae bacterium]|jgi:predicted GNAT superfamily acetyltransferase|nr:hypothetical protein [Zoogloeaceae bacterium]